MNVDAEATPRLYGAPFLKKLQAALATPPDTAAPGSTVRVEIDIEEQLVDIVDLEELEELIDSDSSSRDDAKDHYPKKAVYQVQLDRSAQVLSIDVPEDVEDDLQQGSKPAHLYASFADLKADLGRFLPAAALGLKAKQFDDGLYAAIELAADAGLGHFNGRKALLDQLIAALLAKEKGHEVAPPLVAAARLGGQSVSPPDPVGRAAGKLETEFLANHGRSKPLGFYTWSKALGHIFRRDRMLQDSLRPAQVEQIARAIAADPARGAAYADMLELAERLTTPFAGADLRPVIAAIAAGKLPNVAAGTRFLPPSVSHEIQLGKKLYGDRPIPDGFSLADELVTRIRAGQLSLKPDSTSGWYDHQAYALEALVSLENMAEGKHLQVGAGYQRELVGLFKALLALARETHVKQLEEGLLGAGLSEEIVLEVQPGLQVEPLATYFLRRARSYQFVRQILDDSFGADALNGVFRLTAGGPVNLSLPEELRLMEAIFVGAYLTACAQIGLTPELTPNLGTGKGPSADLAVFDVWVRSAKTDPDLGQDVRMMVPVFYDVERQKTKVWVVLGMATRPLVISFATPPAILSVRDASGRPVDRGNVRVAFCSETAKLVYVAAAEVYVSQLLNRAEFRAHCDTYKSYGAIIDSLR